jgi:single-strand DNA-binding protein
MSSLNKVTLIGNLGKDPEIKMMQSGDKLCNLTIATSERWKDKNGERQERTEWHRVVIFNKGIVGVAEQYLRKGSKIYLEGQLETRKWEDQQGQERYSTEVVLRPYKGELVMLDGRNGDSAAPMGGGGYSAPSPAAAGGYNAAPAAMAPMPMDDFDDDIPF